MINFDDFPRGPENKKGWPWIFDVIEPSNRMKDGSLWPKISIVTPSFNQGEFLEETIRSVLLQNYPNLEYIIIDGGSKDNSVEIIKKYEAWITYWVSESDLGQVNAINKGLKRCTGKIFNWINSDDFLTEGALITIAENFINCDLIAGPVKNFNSSHEFTIWPKELKLEKMIQGSTEVIYQQPGTWLNLENLRNCGPLNEKFHYSFDWFMMLNYLYSHPNIKYVGKTLANFRLHSNSKTIMNGLEFRKEIILIATIMMYEKKFIEIFPYDSIKCIQKYLWIEELDRIRKYENWFSAFKKIFFVIFQNIFCYPYRYAFGIIRALIVQNFKK